VSPSEGKSGWPGLPYAPGLPELNTTHKGDNSVIGHRRRLAAIAAASAATLFIAGCGGSGGSGNVSSNTEAKRTEAVKGGTIFSLEQSVTEHLDPQRTYVGRDMAYLGRTVYRSLVMFPPGETDPKKGATPIPDLATDTGQSNADATEWSFTLKDGPVWQDGKPITCEDLKYGVSRTFATDVITGGPNYILGFLDIPEDKDGTPAYKGPYTGQGQADFDKAVTCDGNTITYRFKKPWPDFPLAIASLAAFDPYRQDQDQGDKSNFTIFSNGPYMLQGQWNQDTGGTLVRNPKWDPNEDKNREANPDQFTFQIGIEAETVNDRLIADQGDDANAITSRQITPAQYPQITGAVADRAVNFQSIFSNYLLPNFNRVTNLQVRQALAEAAITEGHARAILTANGEPQRLRLLARVLAQRLSVRETEALAREMNAPAMPTSVETMADAADPDVERLEDAFRQALGTRVRLIRGRHGGGRLVIHFFSDEELQGIYEAIVGD